MGMISVCFNVGKTMLCNVELRLQCDTEDPGKM